MDKKFEELLDRIIQTKTKEELNAVLDSFLAGQDLPPDMLENVSGGMPVGRYENGGWERYICSDWPCADELRAALKKMYESFGIE